MSCYFRHMKDILDEASIEVTKENKKEVDEIIHSLANEAYKNCSPTWKAVKEQIKGDDKVRGEFIAQLKRAVKAIWPAGLTHSNLAKGPRDRATSAAFMASEQKHLNC